MSNQYFSTTFDPNNNESELYRQGANEICESRGVDFYFIPRTIANLDLIFGEDTISEFTSNKPITLYIENYADYDNSQQFFGKFNFTAENTLTLISEMVNFESVCGVAPSIGDLIYHPAGDRIFEITFIDDKNGFFQFNHDDYVYRMTCKLFEYSHEEMDTGIDEVDIINDQDQNTSDEEDELDNAIAEYLDLNETDVFGNV